MAEKFPHVGEAIRWRRQQLNLTQEDLCTKMGLEPERISYISAVETGKQANMRLDRLELFASALDFSAPDLLLLVNSHPVVLQ